MQCASSWLIYHNTFSVVIKLDFLLFGKEIAFVYRNAEKTASKIEDIESSIAENKTKIESLEKELKQMEVDATKILDEHKQAQVC